MTWSDFWEENNEEMSGAKVVVAELCVSPTQAGMQLGALVCNQYVALGNSCKVSFSMAIKLSFCTLVLFT